ncbi:hypothetical protein CD58_18055 [Pseudomonas brassicacearum]|uniref:hypothetical protein n=1 Tax=Pseudomonas brassicacearum TaxID=930166 RepID=UPI00042E247B|nr:hypothetical protein [Pseudomonas brassicacearum]AHL36904.1 hypothetical protein CD58_18055 [Pseudomonas brassicacearum]
MVVGNPQDPAIVIGPLVNRAQFDRVPGFIRCGQSQGVAMTSTTEIVLIFQNLNWSVQFGKYKIGLANNFSQA